jgi:SNF family Na+-dependent transporter
MTIQEMVLVQHASLSGVLFTGLGYCTLIVITLITIYYQVIIAWTIFYVFASFRSELGWGSCGHDFNTNGESQEV